jgi:hypothetical protein
MCFVTEILSDSRRGKKLPTEDIKVKKNSVMRTLLIALVVLVPLGLVVLGISAKMHPPISRQLASASQTTRLLAVPQSAAAQPFKSDDPRSLKEKAKESGNYVEMKPPKKAKGFANLAELAAASTVVAVGVPQGNTCKVSPDGRSATIDYNVQVEYLYKGKFKQGDIITVRVPGGRVSFDDGTTAEVRTPWFKKMQAGQAYALFLTPDIDSQAFVTTGEAQGLFEIPTTKGSTIIQTHTGVPNDAVRKYNGMNAKDFLTELRKVTGKKL